MRRIYNFAYQYKVIKNSMALKIADIPVLTGSEAVLFEERMRQTEKEVANRTPEEKRKEVERYRRNMEMVRSILSKAKL